MNNFDEVNNQRGGGATRARGAPANRYSRRRHHNQQRGADFRRRKDVEYAVAETERVKEKLLFGLKGYEDLLKRSNEVESVQTLPLPISTRGIGFHIVSVYRTFMNYLEREVRIPSIYASYRIALYAVEAKVQSLQGLVPECSHGVYASTQRGRADKSFYTSARTVSGLSSSITTIINAIGIVKRGDSIHLPVLPGDVSIVYNGAEVYCPLPDRITLSNLRRTVVALADVNTPFAWRESFFQRSPLPGAQIVNNLLVNRDEIMPEVYGEQELFQDIETVRDLTHQLQHHVPKLAAGLLDPDPMGADGILLSNGMGNLRTSPRPLHGSLFDYYRGAHLTGDVKGFWSPTQLSEVDRFTGAAALVGELPSFANLVRPLHHNRAKEGCAYMSNFSFRSATAFLYQ